MRLPRFRVDVIDLGDRLADPLGCAAVRLAVNDQGIDAATHVVDRGESGDVDRACFGVHLALADRAAVREYRIVHLVVGDDGESARQFPGQEGFRGVSRQFQKAVRPERVRSREAAVCELYLRRAGLQHVGRDFLPLLDELLCGQGEHGRRVAHRAAGMRAAAYAHHVGVAEEDVDRFHGYRQQPRHHLREARLVTLPRWLRADHDLHAPRGSDADLGALFG